MWDVWLLELRVLNQPPFPLLCTQAKRSLKAGRRPGGASAPGSGPWATPAKLDKSNMHTVPGYGPAPGAGSSGFALASTRIAAGGATPSPPIAKRTPGVATVTGTPSLPAARYVGLWLLAAPLAQCAATLPARAHVDLCAGLLVQPRTRPATTRAW